MKMHGIDHPMWKFWTSVVVVVDLPRSSSEERLVTVEGPLPEGPACWDVGVGAENKIRIRWQL